MNKRKRRLRPFFAFCSYTFTARTGIKAQPLVANPDVSYYDLGMPVSYDKVLTADGYTLLSYVTYSGARRYVDIS
ncbi:MAG: SH3 domain-containing protein [Streptococcus sp.]|nr:MULTISPECIES: SH3 domain-containing protein [Streptococcus]MDU3069100.1 SH3 domain-containing protein [Streptococcus sp.]QQB69433.1 SH3 domain-containing protein [Streptococcus salivarius]